MIDLAGLGRELRTRRKALRVPSAELARRIGVSPTYIWLIEQARPRPSGQPSRPSEDVLSQWMLALGMSEEERQRLRELAGYFGHELRPVTPTAPRARRSPALDWTSDTVAESAGPFELGPESWGPSASPPPPPAEDETQLLGQVRHVLARATGARRREEITRLLSSYLRWLGSHVEEEE